MTASIYLELHAEALHRTRRCGAKLLRVIERVLALPERAGLTAEQAVGIYVPFAHSLLALIVFEASLLPEVPDKERR